MKLGIVGSGGIVREVLKALQEVEEVQVTAIFVRPHSKAKGDELAGQYNIPSVYTDYTEFLHHADMDFAYIGLINSAHFSYTRNALLAGKNVIVEKPFASNLKEVKLLAELAQGKKLFLFEAVSLLHMPNYAKLKELLPQIGRITMVQANYSQYSSRYDKYLAGEVLPAFDPALSGGSLYDINIYNLNLIIGLFGAPETVSYTASIGFNGIDTSGVALLQYKGFPAIAVGAKDSDSPSGCTIQGEKGWLRCDGVPGELNSVELCLRKQEPQLYRLNTYTHRLAHEFKDFADIFAAHDLAACEHYLNISLQVAAATEKARLSVGIHFPADSQK